MLSRSKKTENSLLALCASAQSWEHEWQGAGSCICSRRCHTRAKLDSEKICLADKDQFLPKILLLWDELLHSLCRAEENALGNYEDRMEQTHRSTVAVSLCSEARSFLCAATWMECWLIKKTPSLCSASISSYKLKILLLGGSPCVAQVCGKFWAF